MVRICFGWLAALFFDFGKQVFVYELDGQLVGAVTLGLFRIDRQRRGGLVKWIFTLPEARGMGAASELLSAALHWFELEECSDVFACVEGYNTPSSNRFSRAGFCAIGFREQLRRFGRHLPRVWIGSWHLADTGFFLWHRDAAGEGAAGAATPAAASPEAAVPAASNAAAGEAASAPGAAQAAAPPSAGVAAEADAARHSSGFAGFAATVLLHSLFLGGVQLRYTDSSLTTLLWQAPLVLTVLLGLRLWAMSTAARVVRLPVQYRIWESGLLLTGAVSLLFGGFFFAPGSLYPREQQWRLRDKLPQLGPIAYAGALSMLVLGWGLQILDNAQLMYPEASLVALALGYIRFLLIFEILLPVFPFTGFNGRRVLDWRRSSWGVLALGTILLWIIAVL